MKKSKRQLCKLLALVVVFILVFGLTSCGENKPEDNPKVTEPTIQTTPTIPDPGESEDPTEPVDTTSPTTEPEPDETEPTIEETEHVHDYQVQTTEATCVKDGKKVYTCNCGDSYEEQIKAIGHDFSAWKIIKNATCEEYGESTRTCKTCGEVEKKAISKTSHKYKDVVTAPTCTEPGYTTHTCEYCGKVEKDSYTEASHKFSAWTTTKEPTCEANGESLRKCQSCGYSESKSITRLGHNYKETVVAPTCTEEGYSIFSCQRCNNEYTSSKTKPLGHTYAEWVVSKSATCMEAGEQHRDCECGATEIKTISPIGHDLIHHEAKPATCISNGWNAYDTCSRCDFTSFKEIIQIGHVFGEPYISKEATCTEPGVKTRMCLNCKQLTNSSIPEYGHNYAELKVEPTCTEDGYTAHICSRCNDIYKDCLVEKVGHDYGEWTQTKEPTCTEKGLESRTCKSCGDLVVKEIQMKQHMYKITTYEPTCTEQGYDLWACACGDSFKENFKNPEHDFGEWETISEPTCTKEGEKQRACSKCNSVELEPIEKISHNYTSFTTPPSCTDDGFTTYTCLACGDSYVDDVVLKLEHSYGEWEVTKEPTCTEVGEESCICGVCGHTLARPADKLAHSYGANVTPPTCTEDGYTTYTCECGDSYTDDIIPAAHTYDGWYVFKEVTCTEDGEERNECSKCDHYETKTIVSNGHKFETNVVEPTCTEEGYTTYTCRCGYSEQRDTTPVIPHNYIDTVVAPTCKEEGYTLHECDMCGDNYKDTITEKAPHNWGDWSVITEPTLFSVGKEQRVCSSCEVSEERDIDKLVLDSRIVAYYTVVDGKVIDIVSGKEMADATVDGEYFRGGKVVLPSSYEAASIETVMVYNRTSTDLPIGNGLSYYGGAFLFQEVSNLANWGMIKTPFGGGWIGTNFTLRPSFNYNKRVLGDGESYWCLAFNKAESTHALQINDDYVEKSHWSNYINKTFTLSAEHQFKSFAVYSTKLTKEEMAANFEKTGIETIDDKTIIGRLTDGISGLGSAFAYIKEGINGIPEWYNSAINPGNYHVDDGNGMDLDYTISDYVEPNLGIDNSKYESVHIIKKPTELYTDYKYALSAVPYPFNVNHDGTSDQYDVSWNSSDTSVAIVIDGLIVPKKAGTVTITATLRGTSISDSCTITIKNKPSAADRIFNVPSNYVSSKGNSFSDTNYTMTTNAIYDAIDEAYFAGYNHVVFPKIDFYAAPTGTSYYIPTGMTVEFPEGSTFHMMPSDIAKSDGYTYFQMGGAWWSCAVPTDKYSVDKDENGNILAYYCRDSHLIIDKYCGEFYKENATMADLNTGANEYAWGCVLLSMGKRAEYCSVEVREANCPTGFFITMGGKGNAELVNAAGGSIAADKFVSGWLDDTGAIVENSNWISTPDFFTVSPGASNGMDTLHEYYIGEWEHNVTTATQHLYDILWFDENKELIQINRWQYIDEGYENKPDGAKYFKISMQQSSLPTGTSEYISLRPDESTRFCEIKNTNIINGADGLASVVGATEACWIHDNYVSGDGLLSGACWSLDLEDGWMGMRGTVIERNIFRKYAYSASHGEYRGPDSGIVALASGYNTFVISNYIGGLQQSNYNVANTHIINNVIHSMFSSFTSGKPNEIRTKINAHVFYNTLGQTSNAISANGVVYYYGNDVVSTVNLW